MVDFLTISRITKTYTKTIPGLYRGPPPKTRVGTRMNKPKVKIKAKGDEKSVRPEKERNN